MLFRELELLLKTLFLKNSLFISFYRACVTMCVIYNISDQFFIIIKIKIKDVIFRNRIFQSNN